MTNITYPDLITLATNLEIPFIPWEICINGANLGQGASMNVFSGTCEVNGTIHKVAFKSLRARLNGETRPSKRSFILRDIKQEIRIMGSLKGHSRIVQLLAVSFHDHIPVLILDLAKDNLEEYLQKGQDIEWKIKLGFMYDIALGLEAIHKVNAVHGDMKAANILLYESDHDQMIAKISDFGFSTTDFSVQVEEILGYSPHFRSPESFNGELSDWNGKPNIDIYSYGLVVHQIADNGSVPFDGYEDEMDDMKREGTELAFLMDNLPYDTPAEVRKVIMGTVRTLPWERLSLEDVKITLKESTEWNQIYSYEEAKTAFESIIQKGSQGSILMYKMKDLPIPPSLKTSIYREYKRLADTGDITALFMVGSCWDYGFGVEEDFSKAVEYFQKAADAGSTNGQSNLAYYYERGLGGLPKDINKAVELYAKAAEAGNTFAQTNMGIYYKTGNGVTKDYVKAFNLFTKAAEAGNGYAQCCLASCYSNGQGVTRDLVKSFGLNQKAAKDGVPTALFNLGQCYFNGQGINIDYVKAAEWYKKAGEAGDTDANLMMEVSLNMAKFFHGLTPVEFFELNQKVAEAGITVALYNLGHCYFNGHGVNVDYVKAAEWYKKAVDSGSSPAEIMLEESLKVAKVSKN